MNENLLRKNTDGIAPIIKWADSEMFPAVKKLPGFKLFDSLTGNVERMIGDRQTVITLAARLRSEFSEKEIGMYLKVVEGRETELTEHSNQTKIVIRLMPFLMGGVLAAKIFLDLASPVAGLLVIGAMVILLALGGLSFYFASLRQTYFWINEICREALSKTAERSAQG